MKEMRSFCEGYAGFVKLVGVCSKPTKDVSDIRPVLNVQGVRGYLIDGKFPYAKWVGEKESIEKFVAVFEDGNASARGVSATAEHILESRFINARYINQSGVDLCKQAVLGAYAKAGPKAQKVSGLELGQWASLKPGGFRTMFNSLEQAKCAASTLLALLPIYGLRCEVLLDPADPWTSKSQILFLNERGLAKMSGKIC